MTLTEYWQIYYFRLRSRDSSRVRIIVQILVQICINSEGQERFMTSLGVEYGTSPEVEELRRQVAQLRRELAEEALTHGASRLALIFNGVSDLLFLIGVEAGPRFRCLTVNHAYLKGTGLAQEQLVGKLVEEILPPEEARGVIKKYTAAMQRHSPTTYEESADVPAGRLVVETRLTPVFDEQGNCTHLLGASRDITERRRMVKALQESEKQYRNLFENANDALATFALDGTITTVNRAAERLTGWSREEMLGQHVSKIATPASVAIAEERTRRFLTGERLPSATFEVELVCKDGRIVIAEARTRAIRDATGKPIGFQGIYRDVTERRQMEVALRESEQRYRAVVETQTELICRFRPDTTLTFVNEAYCRYFGKAREELLGTSFLSLIPGHARSAAKAHIESLIAHPRLVVDEHEVITAGGDLRWQQWTDQAIVDDTGQPTEFQSTGLDITERKRAEEALHHLQGELAHVSRVATMGEMAASIAHEVNQPLGAIVGNADICLRWLASAAPDLAQVRDALGDIIRDGHRASEVITRIRSFVRKEASQRTTFNLNEVVRETLALVSHEIQRAHILLQAELAADLPPVCGDRIQLGQVILNLIMNGIEAMTEIQGRARQLIISSGRDEANAVLIAVQDCGVGIDPQETKRIFAAFYTTKPGGMGMGLAICRSIIEAHGGRLWIMPHAGPGATFQFTLPSNGEAR